jgi:peptidoglycan/LPS O-acetylase OafA/YrhL
MKGLPAGYRTTFAQIMRILAMVTGTAAVVQFALAGLGAFGSLDKERDWGAHETLGSVIGGLTLLVLIAAIVSRPGVRPLVASIVLFVLAAPIQPILANAGKNDGVGWGALHALCGVIILATSGIVSRKIDATPAQAAPTVPAAS